MDSIVHCQICLRETPKEFQEEHHLIPKCKKGKETIIVCSNCGDKIHQVFSIKELKDKYNTIESIKQHQDIIEWCAWISNQQKFSITMKTKKKKKRKRR